MKFNIIGLLLLISMSLTSYAQPAFNVGAGYFGHTLSHPGVVVHAEIESADSIGASLITRMGLGAYTHPRHDIGGFLEMETGMRRTFPVGIFVEEAIGIGILGSWINSDGIYTVSEDGTTATASRMNPVDFMPSVSVGIGYTFEDTSGNDTLIWLRPKVYWRFPHKMTSTFVPVVQLGITRTVKQAVR